MNRDTSSPTNFTQGKGSYKKYHNRSHIRIFLLNLQRDNLPLFSRVTILVNLIPMSKELSIKQLMQIPGVGKSIANDLWQTGIRRVEDLDGKDPQILFEQSNRIAGTVQDRCLLYVFRCAVYYAETKGEDRDPEKLKWWNWKDERTRK